MQSRVANTSGSGSPSKGPRDLWAGLGNIGAGSIGLADVVCLSEGDECLVEVVAQSAL